MKRVWKMKNRKFYLVYETFGINGILDSKQQVQLFK